ncbi:MAG: hypothetical protein ACUVX9_06110 [Anaerolineae bacterium]
MQNLVGVMQEYGLDFDDAYQYVAAGTKGAVIVRLYGDCDRTPQGRKTPQQVLALAPSAREHGLRDTGSPPTLAACLVPSM